MAYDIDLNELLKTPSKGSDDKLNTLVTMII